MSSTQRADIGLTPEKLSHGALNIFFIAYIIFLFKAELIIEFFTCVNVL